MKKFAIGFMTAALIGGAALVAFSGSQDKPKESVTVTAVEIPVRVFDENGFVAGLTREDFEIYEGGVRQQISGFESVSRSILPLPVESPNPVLKVPRPKSFILIFNVYAFTPQIREAIGYFFEKVYNPGDRLVVIVNEGLLRAKPDETGEEILERLTKVLVDVEKDTRRELERTFRYLEKRALNLELALNGDPSSDYPMDFETDDDNDPSNDRQRIDPFIPSTAFFQDYKRTWEDYRRHRLTVNLDLYRTIANRFGKLEGDKWAICFQQRDLFPKIKTSGRLEQTIEEKLDSEIGTDPRASIIQAQRHELERSFDADQSYPRDKIQALFTQANITFHVFVMKALGIQEGLNSEDIDVREVRAEYENTLREISRETGGMSAFTNDVLEALKAAAARLDQYYLVVYQPKQGNMEPGKKIEVKVHRDKVHVVSLKERTPAQSQGIAVFDFIPGARSVVFRLKNYANPPLDWKLKGRAVVRVTVFDERSVKVFSKETALNLTSETARVSLEIPSVVPGDHFVVIEAYDVVSGEKAVFSRNVRFE